MMLKRLFLVFLIGVFWLLGGLSFVAQAANLPAQPIQKSLSTADHSRFQELDRQFTSGPEVTKACLKCHNLAALQFHDTIHWTWDGRKTDKKGDGKVKTLNNF